MRCCAGCLREDSSSDWKNPPAYKTKSGQIPPPTGRIRPQTHAYTAHTYLPRVHTWQRIGHAYEAVARESVEIARIRRFRQRSAICARAGSARIIAPNRRICAGPGRHAAIHASSSARDCRFRFPSTDCARFSATIHTPLYLPYSPSLTLPQPLSHCLTAVSTLSSAPSKHTFVPSTCAIRVQRPHYLIC